MRRCHGDTFGIVGADQSLIQQLPFLVRHIGNQQTEEYVELLDFGGQFGELDSRPSRSSLTDRSTLRISITLMQCGLAGEI